MLLSCFPSSVVCVYTFSLAAPVSFICIMHYDVQSFKWVNKRSFLCMGCTCVIWYFTSNSSLQFQQFGWPLICRDIKTLFICCNNWVWLGLGSLSQLSLGPGSDQVTISSHSHTHTHINSHFWLAWAQNTTQPMLMGRFLVKDQKSVLRGHSGWFWSVLSVISSHMKH